MKHTRSVLGLLLGAVILCTMILTGCSAAVSEIDDVDRAAAKAALDLLESRTETTWSGYKVDKDMSQVETANPQGYDWNAKGIAILKDAETGKKAYRADFSVDLLSIQHIGLASATFKLAGEELGEVTFLADLEECAQKAKDELFPEKVSSKWGEFQLVEGAETFDDLTNPKANDWEAVGSASVIDPAFDEPCTVSFTETLRITGYQDMKVPQFELAAMEIVPLLDEETVKPLAGKAAAAALLEEPPEAWEGYAFDAEAIHLEDPELAEDGTWTAVGTVDLHKDADPEAGTEAEDLSAPVAVELKISDYEDLRTPIFTAVITAEKPAETESGE